ncbi:MAG: hypothetical protein JJ866_14045 [Roseibium sp.]|uniref:hypothetical protein n=1 Tax=Roseibium sp. TaxID=1936156 RepID=UPI001B18B74B|nr:hypothetical protein [Roseibium sp.]MBO6511644.1 hypothetical protein [Roseibium sp.]MBO6893059.1 hypothetical protein [Roseibium sp.]MBO6929958.1 hypothetical protein [Roseibium sp.]
MTRSKALLSVSAICSLLLTGNALGQSDFYIRSMYADGSFVGSHEVLAKPKEGYYEARYCDRTFWVPSSTVIWTEEQTAAGMALVLEENINSETHVVCSDNQAFATLDDLGLKKKEVEQIRNERDRSGIRTNRLRTIRDAFKQFK